MGHTEPPAPPAPSIFLMQNLSGLGAEGSGQDGALGGGGRHRLLTPGPGRSVRDAPPRACPPSGPGQDPTFGMPSATRAWPSWLSPVASWARPLPHSSPAPGASWAGFAFPCPAHRVPRASRGLGVAPTAHQGIRVLSCARALPAPCLSVVVGTRTARMRVAPRVLQTRKRRWQRRSAPREDAGRGGRRVPPGRAITHHPRGGIPTGTPSPPAWGQTGHVPTGSVTPALWLTPKGGDQVRLAQTRRRPRSAQRRSRCSRDADPSRPQLARPTRRALRPLTSRRVGLL